MPSFRTIIARSPSEMDALLPLWDHLLRQQPHSLFQRFSWNRLAAHLFGDRLTPYVVCVQSDIGAAIIPAAIHRADNRLELLGELLFDYRDVLHEGDPEIFRHAWQQVANLRKPLQVVAVDQAAVRSRWSDFSSTPFANAPQVDRTMIDEYAFRSAHPRLGRQMRRLHRQGVVFKCFSGQNAAMVRHLYGCKRIQFAADENNIFLDPRRSEFMVAAAAMEGASCEIYVLEAGSSLVAGLVTFRDADFRRFYTIYFNPEWARYSPGQALLYEVTARSLANGLSCDYMTGEYAYKLRLANRSRPLVRIDLGAEQLADVAKHESVSTAA